MALVSNLPKIPVLFSPGKGLSPFSFQYLTESLALFSANNISAVILDAAIDQQTATIVITQSAFRQVCPEQSPVQDCLEDLINGVDREFNKIKSLFKYVDVVFVVGLPESVIGDLSLQFPPIFLDCPLPQLIPFVVDFLKQLSQTTPLYGCILIGGKSSRMGQPKQLISYKDKTWFEIIFQQLSGVCHEVIAAGKGELPAGQWQRVYDEETCKGPLSGILAAMCSKPSANFIVCSCDLPYINEEAVNWLLQQWEPGVWAILPGLAKNYVEPLFAYYDHKMFSVFQKLASSRNYQLSQIVAHCKTKIVRPPVDITGAWKNCNTTGDIPRRLSICLR